MSNGRQYRGMIYIMEGLSGGGKTTLGSLLTQTEKHIGFSVSATSRDMREKEKDGIDYYFMSKEEFVEKEKNGYFLETTVRYGNYYGTPKCSIEEALVAGEDLIFDVDYKGARLLKESFPDDVIRLLLMPPSYEELARRILNRETETEESFKIRMKENQEYFDIWKEYDYIFINDTVQDTLKKLQQILRAERLKRTRQPWLKPFMEDFKDSFK